MVYDVIVLGGGVAGLATLEALTRRDEKLRVLLIERFELGHSHGSSHGHSRISRAAYHDPLFANLSRVARSEDWPRLERAAGKPLLFANTGCILGPASGQVPVYAEACRAAGAAVESITLDEARRAFPALRFPDNYAVLRDDSASVVAAAETIEVLVALARERGAEIREETRCLTIDRSGTNIILDTDHGKLETKRLVVTAGSWTASLLPEYEPQLTTVRQMVAYFELDAPVADMQIGKFPIWIHLGAEEGHLHYGLPEFGRPGIKAARHRAQPEVEGGDDPEPTTSDVPQAEIDELREWFAPLLNTKIKRVIDHERCLYTLTRNEDFRLCRLSRDSRITVGTGLSGHGFKFAPLLGRLLSELALDGGTSVAEFEAARARFG